MTHQAYGQHCGLVRALQLIGEPWAMLMIRDLLVEPKTAAELQHGLPPLDESTLTTRLDEMEQAHVVRRREPVHPGEASAYELTEYGAELDDVVVQLCRWGLRTLGNFRSDEIMTIDGLVTALRVTFRPEAARGTQVNFVVEMGDAVVHARVDDGKVEIGKGHLFNADLIIEAGPPLQLLLAGEMSPREALETGSIRLKSPDGGPGNTGLLMWFVELFHIPPPPIRTSSNALEPSLRSGTPMDRFAIADPAFTAGAIR